MPSGAKKRKAAKKKKQNLHQSHSHGEDLKRDDGKREAGSESLNINKQGLQRSSSSSSSSSGSVEKSSVVGKDNIVVDNLPTVELVKETNSFVDDQVTENVPGTASISDLQKTALSEDTVQVTTSLSNTDTVTSHSVRLGVNENFDDKLGFVDEKATVSEVLVEVEKRIDEASATLHDGTVAASDAKASAVIENEDKLELSYNAPTGDASVRPDNVKDTPARDYEHQPPVALAPRPVQTTSWKSCCGLFEVFAGSNR